MNRRHKICTAQEAAALVPDHAVLAASGHMNSGLAEALCIALEERFLREGHPRGLTLVSGSGAGDRGTPETAYRGFEHFAHDGMTERVIVGHNGSNHRLIRMQEDHRVTGYNFPQGVVEQLLRERSRGMGFLVTRTGLGTFMDPRQSGGRMDPAAPEMVHLTKILGQDYLVYEMPPVDVALIRGTVADEDGNLSCCEEAALTNIRTAAMAAKASGGIVLCQVKKIVPRGTLPAAEIHVPGMFVDRLILCGNPERDHRMTQGTVYEPSYAGQAIIGEKAPKCSEGRTPDRKKIIARRVLLELQPGKPVNLGIGLPELVAEAAAEEGILDRLMLTVDTGVIGGVPAGGESFGAAAYPSAFLEAAQIYDLYDGGFLDCACLGIAQCDPAGNVNATAFPNLRGGLVHPGAGGFINLTQGARTVVFCTAMTAGGRPKFVREIPQISFAAKDALRRGQRVLYVTESGVFGLTDRGLCLQEIAPGADLEKDILQRMEFVPEIAADLGCMDRRIFMAGPMGLRF